MFVSKVFPRISRNSLSHYQRINSSQQPLAQLFSSNADSLLVSSQSSNKWVPYQVTALHRLVTTTSHKFWYSSSASPQPTEKESNQSSDGQDGKATEDAEESAAELSYEDLTSLVAEKRELLKLKDEEIKKMQDKVLRSYAEMENVKDRTRREAENSKKFAIQGFAKGLLDVADNLGRASSVVKDSFSKMDTSSDTAGAVPLLKTLLEGVEMTDKQLAEVLKKFGVEKFDPLNEQFDPNRHHALFQIPDGSKPSGTVAAVLKPGYMLHDRIIRPAEVGVTESSDETN